MQLITIAGGSCSGKSTLAKHIPSLFPHKTVAVLALDRYYDDTSHLTPAEAMQTNLDTPDAIDIGMALRDIEEFHTGTIKFLPQYNFVTRKRTFGPYTGLPADILVLEGLFTLHYASLNEMSDFKIFIEATSHVMLTRRIARDIQTRGTTEEDIRLRYNTFIQDSYETIISQTQQHADITIDGEMSTDNQLSIVFESYTSKFQHSK